MNSLIASMLEAIVNTKTKLWMQPYIMLGMMMRVKMSTHIVMMMAVTGIAIARGKLATRVGLFWVALWLTALVAAAFPDLTTIAANAVGIDRGKDLVMYLATVVMMAGFFAVYLRLRRIRREPCSPAIRQPMLRGVRPSDARRIRPRTRRTARGSRRGRARSLRERSDGRPDSRADWPQERRSSARARRR